MTDAKVRKLVMQYGAEGYAIYFHCLELIAGDLSSSHITFELEHDAAIIADDLKIKGTAEYSAIDRVNMIMRYMLELKLFEASNEHIFCFKLLKRIDSSMTGDSQFREAINEAKRSHDFIMSESCQNRIEDRTNNTKKEHTKPNKPSNKYESDFDSFWTLYPRKKNKDQAMKTYNGKRDSGITHDHVIECLTNYLAEIKARNTDIQYVKYAASFLNNMEDYAAPEPITPHQYKANGFAPQSGCRTTASFSEIYHED